MEKGIARVSGYFEEIEPSRIRAAQMKFRKRVEKEIAEGKKPTKAINVAIGNVSLLTHPAMLERYLKPQDEALRKGVWRYTETVGRDKCNEAFTNIIKSFLPDGVNPKLYSMVSDGSSQLMRLAITGMCGEPGKNERPLLVIDPIYTNYLSIARETGRSVASVRRTLQDNGKFTDVGTSNIESSMKKHKPGALLIIPYDNPSGQLMRQKTIEEYARLCLENEIFLISDEAYRGLYYTGDEAPTIWRITDSEVPGIEKARIRISLETLSKVFNACGLRMGAIVTDNEYFHQQAVAANTTYLCASALNQYIGEAMADQSREELQQWVAKQRGYYGRIMKDLHNGFKRELPEAIVSLPEAAIYSVTDMRRAAKPGFDANDFVDYCAAKGAIDVDGQKMTLLTAPMDGFYNVGPRECNPGKTQMRLALVAPEDEMALVPRLFAELFREYEGQRG